MTKRLLLLLTTHLFTLALGFGLGIYLLPILTAPDGPAAASVTAAMDSATYESRFLRDLKGSDAVHWAEGKVSVSHDRIAFQGKIGPGPDYKLYLAREFVDTRADFLRIKHDARLIGDITSFDRFLLEVPDNLDIDDYTTVVIWCEAFGQFISAAQYRSGLEGSFTDE